MANTELILGLAGIGSTLVSSLGGSWVAMTNERRRQRHVEAAQRVELRKAIRLVRSDVERAGSRLDAAANHGRRWPWSESLTAGFLEQYRERMASDLDDPQTWVAVQSAELAIEKVVSVIVAYGETHDGDRPPVGGPLIDLLRLAAAACEKASDRLLLPKRAWVTDREESEYWLAVGHA